MKRPWLSLLAITFVACSSGGTKARPDGSGGGRSDGVAGTDIVLTADSMSPDAGPPYGGSDVPVDRTVEKPSDASAAADATIGGVPAAGEIRCGIAVCNAATTPCCPATTMMSRGALCTATCPLGAITCDGPEDCPAGRVCCSVETATEGFAGTSCAVPANCAAPSRIVCHSPSDCPSSQGCATPSPAPAAIAPPAGPGTWLVDFLVCRPGG